MPCIGKSALPLKVTRNCYSIYNDALKNNSLIRSSVCSMCHKPTTETIQGHHADYLKPLDIVWLCRKCHRELHYTIHKEKSSVIVMNDEEYKKYLKDPNNWEIINGYVEPINIDELSSYLKISKEDILLYVERGLPVYSSNPLSFIKRICHIWISDIMKEDYFANVQSKGEIR